LAGPGLILKKRLFYTLLIFASIVLLLTVRVGWIQIVEGADLQKKAYIQHNQGHELSPKRGSILDRNGVELAVSASVEKITVNPQDIKRSKKDPEMIAEKLSAILGMEKNDVLKYVTKSSRYEIIKRRIEKATGDKVRELVKNEDLDGIFIEEDTKRFYPYRNLAAQVIGHTGVDNQGLSGIEIVFEQELKGYPGKILGETDAGGRALPFKEEKYISPVNGRNVILTIDETIQHLIEKTLDKAIWRND
jgi:stage V sporulation protein D (sporulation-specific penicillin-binding protein)